MRTFFLVIAFLLTENALAMHAYDTKSCAIGSHIIQIDPFFDESVGLIDNGSMYTEQWLQIVMKKRLTASDMEGTDLALNLKKVVHVEARFDDGCFQGHTFHDRVLATVKSISLKAQGYLNLRADDTVHLNCQGEVLEPSGDKCNQ